MVFSLWAVPELEPSLEALLGSTQPCADPALSQAIQAAQPGLRPFHTLQQTAQQAQVAHSLARLVITFHRHLADKAAAVPEKLGKCIQDPLWHHQLMTASELLTVEQLQHAWVQAPAPLLLGALWSEVLLLRMLPLSPPPGMPPEDHAVLLCSVLRVAGKLRALVGMAALSSQDALAARGGASSSSSSSSSAPPAAAEASAEEGSRGRLPEPAPGHLWVLETSCELLEAGGAVLDAVLACHAMPPS